MSDLDAQIIELINLLPPEQKQAMIDFLKSLREETQVILPSAPQANPSK